MPDSPDTSAAAIVRDHAFEPRTTAVHITDPRDFKTDVVFPPNPYLCGHHGCRLAEAAHIR
jgi:hypothetical protein